jgi:hypothetical protein
MERVFGVLGRLQPFRFEVLDIPLPALQRGTEIRGYIFRSGDMPGNRPG